MEKEKVLIHTIAFSPDGVSTAYLYNDIALGLQAAGYEVVVLTTTPHYNIVQSELAKQRLKRKFLGLYYKSNYNGIDVYHVPQKKFKNFFARVAGFVYWHVISLFLGFAQTGISVIIAPSPPLTIGLIAIAIAKFRSAKVVYNVQEIYPDLLINQGSLKSDFLLSLLSRLERFVYNHCDRVVTIDEVFYQTIKDRFKDPSKLLIIPNFVDTDLYKPGECSMLDKKLFSDTDVLRLMYAGNIGYAQDWKPLLSIAEKLRDAPVEFWIVGEGVAKELLRREVEARQLSSVHLLPYQSRTEMPAIVNYGDIHFIFMDRQMDGQGFPSKIYTIMACKKPLLVITQSGTPLYNFLKDKNCSFLVAADLVEQVDEQCVEIVNQVIADRSSLGILAKNGLSIIEGKYTKSAVVQQYVMLCQTLSQN